MTNLPMANDSGACKEIMLHNNLFFVIEDEFAG